MCSKIFSATLQLHASQVRFRPLLQNVPDVCHWTKKIGPDVDVYCEGEKKLNFFFFFGLPGLCIFLKSCDLVPCRNLEKQMTFSAPCVDLKRSEWRGCRCGAHRAVRCALLQECTVGRGLISGCIRRQHAANTTAQSAVLRTRDGLLFQRKFISKLC